MSNIVTIVSLYCDEHFVNSYILRRSDQDVMPGCCKFPVEAGICRSGDRFSCVDTGGPSEHQRQRGKYNLHKLSYPNR